MAAARRPNPLDAAARAAEWECEVNAIERFIMHPIWRYSLADIARAVKRDWYGDASNSARAIIAYMHENETNECQISYAIDGRVELVLECRVKRPEPPNHLTASNSSTSTSIANGHSGGAK